MMELALLKAFSEILPVAGIIGIGIVAIVFSLKIWLQYKKEYPEVTSYGTI
jgi:hypothetical protein